jgi:hypothetical protein
MTLKGDSAMRLCHKPYSLATFLGLALVFMFLVPRVSAQSQDPAKSTSQTENQAASDDGWHVGITPYLWFAGAHGTVGALGHEAGFHASAGDLLSHVDIGLMGAVELRHKRLVVPVDFMWIRLSDDKGLPFGEAINVTSVKVKATQSVFTPKFGFRFIDGKKIKVDALFGIRYWHLSNSLTLQPTQIGNGFSASANWVDGIGGAKIEAQLSPKVVMTILGDAGGGSARLDYQVAGLLGYKVSKRWMLQAGYRYMNVNYRPQNGFIYNATLSGAILGATFDLK